MIDVLFGESEAGSLKYAKQKKLCPGLTGPPDEVICLALMLDIGDIKETVDSPYRQNLIFSMYVQNSPVILPEAEKELREAGKLYILELQRLTKFLQQGNPIRIWYSSSPYSLCGLCFLCHYFRKFSNDLFVIKLPPHRQIAENTIQSYSRWGEVDPEDFGLFLPCGHKLSSSEKRMYGSLWSELVDDNSPLRACVNGKLVGVREDFYDFLVFKYLTQHPVKEVHLIGTILGKHPIGISDNWYAYRIESMIANSRIKVTEDSEIPYARLICLAE